MPLETGFILQGRYRIEHVLGHGGMGAVYLATDESLGIQCAVKENLNVSPDSERQFRREATLLASLRHPNLPRVTNHFILGGQQYLVMDFVEGKDLKERLAHEHPLPEAQVLHWTLQICDALIYLHTHQPPIVHRDIKPANIKLTSSGEAMLVDFGIAKATGTGQKTTTGAVALTPGFAPPEQYGMGHTDGRTDEYALAATLYSLLTNQTPPDSMERLLGSNALTPPDELRPDLSQAVSDAIMRALEVRPDDRFPSVAEFRAALLGEISAMRTVSPAARETVMASAQPTVVRTASPTVMAAVGATRMAPAAAQATAAAPPAKAGGLLWLLPFGFIAAVLLVGGGLTFAFLPKLFPAATATVAPTPLVASPTTAPPTAIVPVASATLLSGVQATASLPPATLTPAPALATATLAAKVTSTLAPATATLEPSLTPSPAPVIGGGGRIAFVSNRDGKRFQVYTMRPDGSDVQQLTTDDSDKWSPTWTYHGTELAWSPDGTQLLYVAPAGSSGTLNIWLINADGSNPHNISAAEPGKPSGDDYNPAWCKDGTIAFTTKRYNNVPQIVTFTLQDPRLRNTSLLDRQGNNPNEWNPTFFPQNCKRMLTVTVQNGMPEIWRVFPDLQSWRVFLSDINGYGASAEEPAVSPNEKFVVYTRYGAKTKDIIHVTIDTVNYSPGTMQTNSKILTKTGNNSMPKWSPDSKWIMFVSQRDGGKRAIYVMTSAGTDQHRISDLDRATLDGTAPENVSPAWQPVAP